MSRPGLPETLSEERMTRVAIEGVRPEVDYGRFPIKRVLGERVTVEADVFTDRHDVLSCVLLYRGEGRQEWAEAPMQLLDDDRWRASFIVSDLGTYAYTIKAWVDKFKTWRRDLEEKAKAGQDIAVDLLVGAALIEEAKDGASNNDAKQLRRWASNMTGEGELPEKLRLGLSEELAQLMGKYPDQRLANTYDRELKVVVGREKARFSAWYEMFPRSCASGTGRHGTFKDCEKRLSYVAKMGFDVLYLPPIHPIGRTHRKGKNNSPIACPNDPGSPWAIGSEQGGHKAVHPQLGTLNDFRQLVTKAKEHDIEIALDLAFHCAPDHPYLKEHPEWFQHYPDGSIQFAETPPQKYEDVYPFVFETDHWHELWEELKGVVLFWIEQGIRIFRVDNPHTKPFSFWEWLSGEIRREYPDVIFSAEAFTRPKVMHRLAKLGLTQSYTYFAWRNSKRELTQYFTKLTATEVHEYFLAHLWPNTPDVLTEYLQVGGRPAFIVRLVLAATLGASYGIYGPAFELCENHALDVGSEEYLDSEKYEGRHWDTERSDSLADLISQVNRIRKENPALQDDWSLRFHPVDNDEIICFSKQTEDISNVILVVVNLDANYTQSGWVELPLEILGLDQDQSYQIHDLLCDAHHLWHGRRNYVELNPHVVPAHIFRIGRRIHTERDFECYI